VDLVEYDDLLRNDLIFAKGNVWSCVSKNLHLFQNAETREQLEIKDSKFIKLKKLELIPIKWHVDDGKVVLEGRELGLGPTHRVSISWVRSFKEMEIIRQ
jgi:hypothetical protein